MLMVVVAGCGNVVKTNPAAKPAAQQSGQSLSADKQQANQKSAQGNQQMGKNNGKNIGMQTPEEKLRRKLMNLSRLGRSDTPITKEQQAKLTPILEDIKVKTTIDDTYAAKKTAEIESILSAAQKQALTKTPERSFGGRANSNNAGNSNIQPPSMPQNSGQNGTGQSQQVVPPQGGPMGPQGGPGGMDLKSLCNKILESWKTSK